jgi:ABC-2 type transport system ATP-binding protein
MVVLLGPNGAGKSTLFHILSGLFRPDGGDVSVAGHDMARETTTCLSALGIVFQQPTIDAELTVRANLTFHARLHGLSRIRARERIRTELERFSLLGQMTDPVRTLSGGTRRKVELARALVHEPRFLLMDEPTVGLDPPSRRDILQHVHRLRDEERIGVLWATHLVDETAGADRVVVLNKGAVIFEGPPKRIVEAAGGRDLDAGLLALLAGNAHSATVAA